MKIRLVTVIWGQQFVDMFLRVGLRSLAARGNLVDLAKEHDVTYTIYTTAEDQQRLESTEMLKGLRSQVNIDFSTFAPREIDASHYGSHNILWTRAFELARRNREALFLLIPDLVYAKSTLVRWAQLFSEGIRAIYTPGPQVVLETIVPELEARFRRGDPISIDRSEITALLLRHFHPMQSGLIRGTHRRVPFAEYDIRPVANAGFVLRELSAQPFCIDPGYFDRITNFSPDDHLDTVVTEPCSTLSVEPMQKRIEWYYRPWRLDDKRLTQLGGWWNHFGPVGCRKDSATAHTFCLSTQASGEVKKAKLAGQFFVSELTTATTLYRLATALRSLGLEKSASVLAACMYAANLKRKLVAKSGTLLVPVNAAYGEREHQVVGACLMPGHEKRLVSLLANHLVLGTGPSAKTASGVPLEELGARDATVLSGPIFVEGFAVYVIDRVLLPGLELTPAPVSPDETPQSVGPLSPQWSKQFSLWGVSEWARRSSLHRAAYSALHVPLIEIPLSLALPAYLSRLTTNRMVRVYSTGKHRVRSVAGKIARRVLRKAESFPAVRPFTRKGRSAYRMLRATGARQTVRYALAELKRLMKSRLARYWKPLTQGEGFIPSLASKLFPGDTVPTLPEASLSKLADIRIARGWIALRDACEEFAKQALPDRDGYPPLRLIEERMSANGFAFSSSSAAIERVSRKLVQMHPESAECWLELGHLKADQGQVEDAISCYSAASRGKQLAPTYGGLDPRAEALTAQARLLTAQGRRSEAKTAYTASLALCAQQSVAQIELAELLRREGAMEQALHYYAAGVPYEETRSAMPRSGRDINDVKLQSFASSLQ